MFMRDGLKSSLMYSAILVSIIFAIAFFSFANTGVQTTNSDGSLNYKGYVCVYKNGELIECNHNLLYDRGKNITRDLLGIGGGGPALTIALCNASAPCATPVAAGTEAFTSYYTCGLTNATGTYATLQGNPGNWTITKTFTSTCDSLTTNVTRLMNASSDLFASNTFSLVTLQTNDQLTINWTISIS